MRDSFGDDGDGDAMNGALAAKMVALLGQRAAFDGRKRLRAFALHERVVVGEDRVDEHGEGNLDEDGIFGENPDELEVS